MSENLRKNYYDSNQNGSNSNSSDRLESNAFVNEIIPINIHNNQNNENIPLNINNDQNIANNNPEEEQKENNNFIVPPIFNNNIQENIDKTDILIELQKSLIDEIKKMREAQSQYQAKITDEMMKIRKDQLEQIEKIRKDQTAELKKIREDQLTELSNQAKSINEVSKMREEHGEMISIVRKLLERFTGEDKKENQNQENK